MGRFARVAVAIALLGFVVLGGAAAAPPEEPPGLMIAADAAGTVSAVVADQGADRESKKQGVQEIPDLGVFPYERALQVWQRDYVPFDVADEGSNRALAMLEDWRAAAKSRLS